MTAAPPAGAPQRVAAETYERYFVPAMFRPWSVLLLQAAALTRGERVLDVACGTGVVARAAAPLVGADGHVAAVDVNPAMLAVAQELPPATGAAIGWHEASALQLPFADASFDAALCQHGLPFFPHRPAALAEMRRVLAPGGRAVVMVLQGLALHPLFAALMESVARRLSLPPAAVDVPFALGDEVALRALFVAAGFATTAVHAVTSTMHFGDPEQFVGMTVMSSAAAIPAFAALQAAERVGLVTAVREDVGAVLARYRQADTLDLPMFALIAVASR